MRKYVRIIYGISVVLAFLMLLFFHFHEKTDSIVMRADGDYEIVNDYEFSTYRDETAPIGIVQEYKWVLENIPKHDACVTFYLIHQEIEVFIGDELFYSLKRPTEHNFSKTTGCFWPQIFLYEEDAGKEIRILVRPIYQSSLKNHLTIYLGDHSVILDTLIERNLPTLVISIFAVLVGLAFLFFIFYNIKNLEIDRSIFMLGIFSILTGLWKISDMEAATLIFHDSLVMSAISIIAISLALVPYMYFIQRQFKHPNHFLWDLCCIIISVVTIGLILLQLFGIADLRETLTICHGMTVLAIIFVMLMLAKEAHLEKFSPKLKLTVICCTFCLIGAVIDMTVYYTTGDSGNMVFCLVSFLFYVIAMGYVTLKETKQLMDRGQEATRYQQLAMHDELTGLFNRAHYSDFIAKNDVLKDNCFIIMMDVNNLKLCNDTRGHDCGDHLLINSANLIRQAFPSGVCHRIGGDEFCVLLCNSSAEECQNCLNHFEHLTAEFNAAHPEEFPVNIAYGYASHIVKIDFDFNDTMRRADRMMYQVKLSMKTQGRGLAKP